MRLEILGGESERCISITSLFRVLSYRLTLILFQSYQAGSSFLDACRPAFALTAFLAIGTCVILGVDIRRRQISITVVVSVRFGSRAFNLRFISLEDFDLILNILKLPLFQQIFSFTFYCGYSSIDVFDQFVYFFYSGSWYLVVLARSSLRSRRVFALAALRPSTTSYTNSGSPPLRRVENDQNYNNQGLRLGLVRGYSNMKLSIQLKQFNSKTNY